MARIIRKVFKVDGVPTNVTSALLSDPTGTYGVKRNDTNAVVVADGTAMTLVSTGTYQYEFTDAVNVAYTAYVEFVYDGATYHFELDFPARTSATGGGPISYSILVNRVGHYLFGAEAGASFTQEQLTRIGYCITDGLRRVYAAHDWSFFKPLVAASNPQSPCFKRMERLRTTQSLEHGTPQQRPLVRKNHAQSAPCNFSMSRPEIFPQLTKRT
jgi:hypothetical protein